MIGVCIITYNQEQYISKCVDSALNQICTEPVRIYVANDCSTDGTEAICRSYGDRIVYINREQNLGLVGNTMALLEQIRKEGCEYIAMLDGDDYWCDNSKLQKQYDYMQIHPEYGLVHTCYDTLFRRGLIPDRRKSYPEGNVHGMFAKYIIGNCTVMFKSELLQFIDFSTISQSGMMSVDFPMYCIFSAHTQFGFLIDHTAIWRRNHESVSNTSNLEKTLLYINNDIAQWKYLSKVMPEYEYNEEAGQHYYHEKAFHAAFRFGDSKRTLREFSQMSCSRKKNKHNRLLFFVANNPVLFYLWHFVKYKLSK